jgi:hypothetical protein
MWSSKKNRTKFFPEHHLNRLEAPPPRVPIEAPVMVALPIKIFHFWPFFYLL